MNKNIRVMKNIMLCGCVILTGCSTVAQQKYIPAMSVTQAVLATGASVSASESAPVLIVVKGKIELPNGISNTSLDGCHAIGIARANISSERIMINLSTLSCITNGVVFDKPVMGYVVGEDAKTGVKSKIELTQGALLKQSTSSQSIQKPQSILSVEPNRKVSIIFESGFWR
ncbi:MAG TPA: TrbI/VirB10 family protein [Burkholderiales bacterium]|nr:TrbI/VirB10 family protein [Burkholderiales bacterium]